MTKSNIAALINAEHAKVEAAKRSGVKHAMECGRLLSEARETTAHGEWDAWVRAHCSFSMRTAQLYVRVHKHLVDDPSNAQRVAGLSLREAGEFLASHERSNRCREQTRADDDATPRQYFDEFRGLWYQSLPAARRKFCQWLRDDGQASDEWLDRVLRNNPDVQDYDRPDLH